MKEQLPSPDFNSAAYQRPNQKWVCGWLSDGHPCPLGPDGRGRCGATPGCKPSRQVREGETDVFTCTRAKELGGPCEEGPRADGDCSQPPLLCQPRLSLRARRGLVTWSVVAATLGGLMLLFLGSKRWRFILPDELSVKHRSAEFAQRASELHSADRDCAACHNAGKNGPVGWALSAAQMIAAPAHFRGLLQDSEPRATAIDASCQQCHPEHTFHEPNVPWEYSCSACHGEHRGAQAIALPEQMHCVRCHGDAALMSTAAERGRTLSPRMFDFQFDASRTSLKLPRPTNGYTQVIHSFAGDHPEFQVHFGGLGTSNTLRFSHQTHRADHPGMTLPKGEKLECVFCHEAGPGGVYRKNAAFATHCQGCHRLQFDPECPTLVVPHGNPVFARAFLLSLPQQYANVATQQRGLVKRTDVEAFVRSRIAALRDLHGSGEQLEQRVFFGDERTSPTANVGRLGDQGRSFFPGCAFCHEVLKGTELPVVTPPLAPERWLSRGRFNHARHSNVGCESCHAANNSRVSTDILIPSKAQCATCHKPMGTARDHCLECHAYHHSPKIPALRTLRKVPSLNP